MSARALVLALQLALGIAGGLLAAPAAAACPRGFSSREMSQQISSGDAAFADMNDAAFLRAHQNLLAILPCVQEAISVNQAAAFHRLDALGGFMSGDQAAAAASFRALRAVVPGYKLPDALAPPGHPLRILFDVAGGSGATPGTPLTPPRYGWIHIDGQPANTAPVDRPYLFQRFDGAGMVQQTVRVSAGMAPPAYETQASSRWAPEPPPETVVGVRPIAAPEPETPQISRRALAVAGGLGLAGAGFYAAAAISHGAFWDTTQPAAVVPLRRTTNVSQGLSIGFSVAAIGVGAGALYFRAW